MSLTHTEEKYINQALSDILERALIYKKKSLEKSRSLKDRTIWRALFIELARTYNTSLMTLGLLATTKIAREKKHLTDALFKAKDFTTTTDEEIEALIVDIYGLGYLERSALRNELNQQYAVVHAVTVNSTKAVREALETLVKHKAFTKFVDPIRILEQQPPEIKALSRGRTKQEEYEQLTTSDLAEMASKIEVPITENSIKRRSILDIMTEEIPDEEPIATDFKSNFGD